MVTAAAMVLRTACSGIVRYRNTHTNLEVLKMEDLSGRFIIKTDWVAGTFNGFSYHLLPVGIHCFLVQ